MQIPTFRALAPVLASILVGSALSPSALAEPPKAAKALTAIIEAHVATHEQAGVSVALVDAKGTAWEATFGLADREKKLAVAPSTIFELGSISKVFTCIAAMQLVEAGKLELDKPLAAYIPEFKVKSRFPVGGEAITIRMLMTHHSGLVTDDDPWETTQPARLFHRAVLEHVKETELLFPPGERWNYSSFGSSLLGVAIERASGMDYADYMRKHVLAPLGMPSASFDYRDHPEDKVAGAYHYNPAYDMIPKDEIRPGGSLRAPLGEAAHLLTMVLEGGSYQGRKLLNPASLQEMMRHQNAGNALAKKYPMGLGFRLRMLNSGSGEPLTVLYHDGVSRHRSAFLLLPSQKAGFIVSVNDHAGGDTFLWELKEAFVKETTAP